MVRAFMLRSGWALVAGGALFLLQSAWQQPVHPLLFVLLAGLAGLSAWRPFEGLLVLAGLGPLSSIIFVLGRGDAGGLQFAEAMVLSFLAGAAVRRLLDGRTLDVSPALWWPALALLVLALGSAVVEGARHVAAFPEEPAAGLLGPLLTRDYLLHLSGTRWLGAALLLVEGLLLMLVVAGLVAGDAGRRERVVRMMLWGAGAAAAFNVLRLVLLAVERGPFVATFAGYFATVRTNVHHGDRNAAGSYFAMLLVVACGLVRRWIPAWPLAALIAAGLWLSGSRVALAAAFAGLAALLWLRSRPGRRLPTALAILALTVGAAAAAWSWYPEGRNFAASRALQIRLDLAAAGLRMAADHPVFGVGVGRYYEHSRDYAGDALDALGFERENAHNQFVQVLAELGIPGLVLFSAVIGVAMAGAWSRAPLATPIFGGLLAFLLTALGGHPLLTPEVAYPFWIALGLAARPAAAGTPARWRAAGVAAILILAMTVPFRAGAASRQVDLAHASTGLSRWQHEPDGARYRWAGGASTFYVPAAARVLHLPLRNGSERRRTLEVRVFLDGQAADAMLLPADDQWRELRIVTGGLRARAAYRRVDLEVREAGVDELIDLPASDEGGALMVGRVRFDL